MARRKKKISVEDAEEYLMDTNPAILDTDPRMKGKVRAGTNVMIVLPKFSRPLRAMQREHFDSRKVKKFGDIMLDDGTILEPNKSYNIPLTFEIKKLLKAKILMGGSRTMVM